MRSLMAPNPYQSARENLVFLFFLKQHELLEKKRRENEGTSSRWLQEPSSEVSLVDHRRVVRREIWTHLQDGRRTCWTTSINGGVPNIDDEELALQTSVEVTIVDLFYCVRDCSAESRSMDG